MVVQDEREATWFACTEPIRMLQHLEGEASARKLRLFAVACCREVWHLFHPDDTRSHDAVEVAERFADRKASRKDVAAARREAKTRSTIFAARMAYALTAVSAFTAATETRGEAFVAALVQKYDRHEAELAENRQADIVREVFGNPFRTHDVSRCVTPEARRIAQTVYDARSFADLPILADAIEEAGCTDDAILDHLRSPGPHYRGCWALDLVLGRK